MTNAEHKIVGEAACALLVQRREVTVSALAAELTRMAEAETDTTRISQIGDARQWLMNYRSAEVHDNRSRSALRGMSRQINSVRIPATEGSKNR